MAAADTRARSSRRQLPITGSAHKAGIVSDAHMGAVLAALDMAAERRGAAGFDRRHHLQLGEAHVTGVGLAPSGAVVADRQSTPPTPATITTTSIRQDTSCIRQRAASPSRHRYPIGLLPASRLTPPRSGLERSDFVRWRNRRLQPKTALSRYRLFIGPISKGSSGSSSDGRRGAPLPVAPHRKRRQHLQPQSGFDPHW